MKFQFWHEGFIFIGFFIFMVGVPCFLIALLGTKLIDNLGQWPSKSARLQMGICAGLLVTEICTFLMLALFFHVFSD